MALARMDLHDRYGGYRDGTPVFDDADGGLTRYGIAIRRVLALCDTVQARLGGDVGIRAIIDDFRLAVAYEMGITQAPPEGSDPRA